MDRRFLLGIALMVLIALAPTILFKKAPQPVPAATQTDGRTAGRADSGFAASPTPSAPKAAAAAELPSAGPPDRRSVPEDTIQVTSPLYRYAFSTRGGRMISASLAKYHSTVKADAAVPLEILPQDGPLFGMVFGSGGDSVAIGDWGLTPSARSLDVSSGVQTLTFTGGDGTRGITLNYRFHPDDYRIEVDGTITGVGPTGGLVLVGLGHGMRNTEADTASNYNEYGIVTRQQQSKVTRLGSLDAGVLRTLPGPFDWVALKSKYFAAAIVAADSSLPRIAGVTAMPHPPEPGQKRISAADTRVSIPVSADGRLSFLAYVGPMEFKRLRAIGREFDDVNPYGWPGFRVLIRFFATPVRWLLVTMHQSLGLTYGVVLILFGLIIKGVTWPLQSKAMRSSMKMQALQPVMKDLQTRYANDPTRLNSEMMALYKKEGVNPLGGCLPMLIPMPVLLALFVVFQYSIELRGTPFLWLTDLSAHDPLYLIPLVMGLSMFAVSKIGQKGLPPNPQMASMVYVMPVLMTVMFARFPAGLNLYYAVSNLAGLPQQWMLTQERLKKAGAPVVVNTKPAKKK